MTPSAAAVGRRVIGAGALALAVAAALHGQTPPQDPQPSPQRPVFRAGANFVAVDAYVTHDGKVVNDLTADDFEVAEDGKKQRVEDFRFVRGLEGPDAEPVPTKLDAASRLAGDSHRRVFVVYLTGYHASHEGAANTQKATTAFFNQSASASDLFGVLRLYDDVRDLVLGERPDVLIDEANSYWDWAALPHPKGWARMPVEEPAYSCIMQMRVKTPDDIERVADLWRAKRILASLEELVVRLASMREARSNILVFAGALPLPMHVGETQSVPILSGTAAPQGDSPCANELNGITAPFLASKVDNIRTTAQRGNVSISFVDPDGLAIFDDDISTPEKRAKTTAQSLAPFEGAKTLALMTGGTAIVGATEIGPALIDLAQAQSGHYEMGYYSSNNKFDGKYRTISVKVHRPGVSVIARKGYQAPTMEMLRASEAAAARAATTPPPPSAAVVAVAELARVLPEARMYGHAARRGTAVEVVAEIASGEVELGHWPDGASVEVHLIGAAGAESAVGHTQIARGARAASVTLPVNDVAAGSWAASIRVTGAGGELTDRIDVPAGRTTLLGDPLIFRASTLPNATFQPVADFTFRRTERIRVVWPVERPLERREARLLDARGQPLAVNTSAMEVGEGSSRMLVADVALVALAPADYVVEVTAASGPDTAQRLLAFRIVR